jgi:hypothetical protein
MRARVSWKKRSSTGPPGSQAVTMIGTAVHAPLASISRKKPGISAGRELTGLRASREMSSPST